MARSKMKMFSVLLIPLMAMLVSTIQVQAVEVGYYSATSYRVSSTANWNSQSGYAPDYYLQVSYRNTDGSWNDKALRFLVSAVANFDIYFNPEKSLGSGTARNDGYTPVRVRPMVIRYYFIWIFLHSQSIYGGWWELTPPIGTSAHAYTMSAYYYGGGASTWYFHITRAY
ncbi:MAG: hypothetical protein ACFFFG_17850 [Candidatus Thorarchaeota archaeon]